MLTLAEKVCIGIAGVWTLAFTAYAHRVKKIGSARLIDVYGTDDINKIMKMSKEDVEELWENNR